MELDEENQPNNAGWTFYECNTCNEISNIMLTITRLNIQNDLTKIKVNSQCALERLDLKFTKDLALQLSNKSAIFSITSKDTVCHHIYWKSKEIEEFLFLEICKDNLNDNVEYLGKFIDEFLENSLKNGHLGILTNHDKNNEITLHCLGDSRNFNLLLIACESGNSDVIRALVKNNIQPQLLESDITAQNLAWKGRHYDVIYELLKANLPYPLNFDVSECFPELKNFVKNNEDLHNIVKENNLEKINEFMITIPNQLYFYNTQNESLLKVALKSKQLEIYEHLLSNNFLFGPHEDFTKLFENFNETDKQALEKVHSKYFHPESHINTIMSNSYIHHDGSSLKNLYNHILKAYKKLNDDQSLRTILKTVAATKMFQVIFDFDSDSGSGMLNTPVYGAKGTTFVSGRIKIGAKKLLHESTEQEVYGIIAHEFCHFAVQATYNNKFNPFSGNDHDAKKSFENISKKCEQEDDQEPIIGSVFIDYKSESIPAELIVRPAQLIAVYNYKSDILEEKKNKYRFLFKFFYIHLIPAMEEAIIINQSKLYFHHIYVKMTPENLVKIGILSELLGHIDVIDCKIIVVSIMLEDNDEFQFYFILRFLYDHKNRDFDANAVENYLKDKNLLKDCDNSLDKITCCLIRSQALDDGFDGIDAENYFKTLHPIIGSAYLFNTKSIKFALTGKELLKRFKTTQNIFDHINLVYDELIFSYGHVDDNIIKSSAIKNQEVNISKEDQNPGCSSNNLKKLKTSEKDFDYLWNNGNKTIQSYDSEYDSDSDSEFEKGGVQEKTRCFKMGNLKTDENNYKIYKTKISYDGQSNFQPRPKETKKYNVEPAENIVVQQDGNVFNSYTLPYKYKIFDLYEDIFASILELLTNEDKLSLIFSSKRFVKIFSASRTILKNLTVCIDKNNFATLSKHDGLLSMPLLNIELNAEGFRNKSDLLNFLMNFQPSVESLVIKNTRFQNFRGFTNAFANLTRIKSIVFEKCGIDYVEKSDTLKPLSTLSSVSFNKCNDHIINAFSCQESLTKMTVRNDDWTWNGFPHEIFNKIAKYSKNLQHIELFGAGTGSFFDSDEFLFRIIKLETTMITFHWYVGIKTQRVSFLESQKGCLKELTIHKLPYDFDGGRVLKYIIEEMNLDKFYYGKIPLILNGQKQEVKGFEANEIQITSTFEMFRQFPTIKSFRLNLSTTDISSEDIENVVNPYTRLFERLEKFEVVDNSKYRSILGVFLGLMRNMRNLKIFILKTPDRNINVLLEESLRYMPQLEEIYLTSNAPRVTERFMMIKQFVLNLRKISVLTQFVPEAKRIFGADVVCEIIEH